MTQQGSFLIFYVGFFDRFQGCMPSVAFICLPLLRTKPNNSKFEEYFI